MKPMVKDFVQNSCWDLEEESCGHFLYLGSIFTVPKCWVLNMSILFCFVCAITVYHNKTNGYILLFYFLPHSLMGAWGRGGGLRVGYAVMVNG